MMDALEKREEQLKERLQRIDALEKEILARESALKDKEKSKKQMLLRLSPRLWEELAAWAEEDFRSINGQVEYLLNACVQQRHKRSRHGEDET